MCYWRGNFSYVIERLSKHFKAPVIHEQNQRHDELLGLYPDGWCKPVEEICLPHETPYHRTRATACCLPDMPFSVKIAPRR